MIERISIVEKECPICGKNFILPPQNYWKSRVRRNDYNLYDVCSYSCMRTGERKYGIHTERRI